MTPFVPTHLKRKVVPRVWGGQSLAGLLQIDLPAGIDIGETWECYDRPDGSSQLAGSERTLRDLMLEDPPALLGRSVRPTPAGLFPLLLKFIDARVPLSVQVHPDDAAARANAESDVGKAEGWVVLDSGSAARIVLGTKAGVTAEQFAAVAHLPAVEGVLDSFRPEPGEAVYVPPGVVHAIGPDVVLFEIQQNSDLTYRLYDWGRPRETHIDKALAATRVADWSRECRSQPEPIAGGEGVGGEWLFRNEHFTLRRLRLNTPVTMGTEGTFALATVIAGCGTLGWRSGGEHPPLVLRRGDTVLVPACTEVVFLSPVGELCLLWSGPGQH